MIKYPIMLIIKKTREFYEVSWHAYNPFLIKSSRVYCEKCLFYENGLSLQFCHVIAWDFVAHMNCIAWCSNSGHWSWATFLIRWLCIYMFVIEISVAMLA